MEHYAKQCSAALNYRVRLDQTLYTSHTFFTDDPAGFAGLSNIWQKEVKATESQKNEQFIGTLQEVIYLFLLSFCKSS